MENDTLSILVTGEFADAFTLSILVEHMESLGVRKVERPEADTMLAILGNQSGYHPSELRVDGRLVFFERDLPYFRERVGQAINAVVAGTVDETLDGTNRQVAFM